MRKIEHIAIAVADLPAAIETYSALLGATPYKTETVEREGVTTVFFQVGETKIELLGALYDESPVAKFIAKRGEGLHHIAFDVADIAAETRRLEAEGFSAIGDGPKPGADQKLIRFFKPQEARGVLVELCQPVE